MNGYADVWKRCLIHLCKLKLQMCKERGSMLCVHHAYTPGTVVTEEELAQALEDGEEIGTPPGPPSAESTNGMTEADSENDPLNFSMMETKYVNACFKKPALARCCMSFLLMAISLAACVSTIRAQLGMKPLPRDKFSSSSPRESGATPRKRVSCRQINFKSLQELVIMLLQCFFFF